MLNIFIGYDPRLDDAYRTLCFSLRRRASVPLKITPLALSELAGIFDRPRDPLQSTDFAFSRFLCPYLSDYRGWSLFMDCDMLNLRDIAKLWALRDCEFAVQVVKHEHLPTASTKFLAERQTAYPRKNWSSLMLMNNARCSALTPDYVESAAGLDLHQFKWIEEKHIGSIHAGWNHLVGVSAHNSAICQLHYTNGGPWFAEHADCPFADIWREEFACSQAARRQAMQGDDLGA